MTRSTHPAAFAWNEAVIIRAICRQVLQRKCLLLVDNCNWTGHECDVLGVTQDLRIIDIEAKISRADFKADAAKDKWWHRQSWRDQQAGAPRVHRDWPPRVWKHYYAAPAEIWRPELLPLAASPASGVILLRERDGVVTASVERRAKPCADAQRITAADAIDIARLANLRMWETADVCWRQGAELRAWRAECAEAS
jgi:hypothetical protein